MEESVFSKPGVILNRSDGARLLWCDGHGPTKTCMRLRELRSPRVPQIWHNTYLDPVIAEIARPSNNPQSLLWISLVVPGITDPVIPRPGIVALWPAPRSTYAR